MIPRRATYREEGARGRAAGRRVTRARVGRDAAQFLQLGRRRDEHEVARGKVITVPLYRNIDRLDHVDLGGTPLRRGKANPGSPGCGGRVPKRLASRPDETAALTPDLLDVAPRPEAVGHLGDPALCGAVPTATTRAAAARRGPIGSADHIATDDRLALAYPPVRGSAVRGAGSPRIP